MKHSDVSMVKLWPSVISGILFADPFDALDIDPELRACVSQWRPTFGGKLLAAFGGWPSLEACKHISGRKWQWPVVPVQAVCLGDACDVWVTGTVGNFSDDRIRSHVTPEVNRRQSRPTADGAGCTPRVSRKLAHRVLWCDRNRGVIVSDPLYRAVFADMEGALAFIEKKRSHGAFTYAASTTRSWRPAGSAYPEPGRPVAVSGS